MELLQFKANISQDCIQRMWHGGYFLRKLSERAADLDALEPWWRRACRQSRHCLTRAYHGEEWRVCNTRKVWGGSLSSLIWVCLGRLWWRTPDICIRRLHPFWFTFCRYSWCHGADFFQRSHQEIWRLGCASLYRQHVVSLHHHGGKHPSACPMQRKGTPWNVSYYGLSSASILACFTPRYTMGIHNQCLPVLCTQQCFRSRDHRSMQC